MKKIIFLVTCFMLAAFAEVQAADTIRVEGESFDSVSVVKARAYDDASLSGGQTLYLWDTPDRDGDYTITYTFNADRKGTYSLGGVCDIIGQGYTTDFYIQVNDEEEFSVTDNSVQGDRIACNMPGPTYYYTFKNVKLKKGMNTLTIKINKADTTTEGRLYTWIDYLEFTKKASGAAAFEAVTCDAPSSVFDLGEKLVFNAELSGEAAKDMRYSYEVENSDREIVSRGSITFREGSDEQKLYLPELGADWYKITFYEYNTRNSIGLKKMFSVIDPIYPTELERNHYAVDTSRGFAKANVMGEQANVAYRCGIDWMRERGSWNISTELPEAFQNEINEGIHLLPCFDASAVPGEHRTVTGNLFEVHDVYMRQSKLLGESNSAIEILNEPDGLGRTSPDLYSSYLKAASIGVSDGSPNTAKTNGGLAGIPSEMFDRLLFQNDFMSYVDAFCYHAHEDWQGTSTVNGMRSGKCFPNVAQSLAYDKSKPIWLNESGIAVKVDDSTGEPDITAQRAKGNHLLKSSAESISYGNNKRFWFLWVHYIETGNEFGNFNANNEPYISVNVMNTMVKTLRESIYRGKMANLPEGATGYLINNGTDDVAVVWSGKNSRYTVYGDNVRAMDMLGKTLEMTAEADGGHSVAICDEPIYIYFDGACAEENYYKAYQRESDELTPMEYDKAKRVVIQQLWEGQDLQYAMQHGYTIDNGQKLTLRVYNFNKEESVSGVIDIDCNSNFKVSEDKLSFDIAPWEYREFELTVDLADDVVWGAGGDVAFIGRLSSGEEISPSVAWVNAVDKPYVANEIKLVEGYDDPSKWNLTNHSVGDLKIEKGENEGELKFSFTKPYATSSWCYPKFFIEQGSMADTDGFTYKVKLTSMDYTEETLQQNRQNLYVYMNDGSSYYFNGTDFINFENFSDEEWTQVTVPWNSLVMWEGDASVSFDPANIKAFSTGFNNFRSSTPVPTYLVRDLGTFVSGLPGHALKQESVLLGGIESEKHYTQDDEMVFTAQLPEGKYNHVKVLLNDDYVYEQDVAGNNVTVDLGKLGRGYWRVQLTAEGERNLKEAATVYFYVD